jgi:hypothetical protein
MMDQGKWMDGMDFGGYGDRTPARGPRFGLIVLFGRKVRKEGKNYSRRESEVLEFEKEARGSDQRFGQNLNTA